MSEVRERTEAEAQIRELNADLQKRAAELQSVTQDLEAFIYSVSHDLRGPLRHINGYASLLREDLGTAPPEEIESYVESILHSTQKMSQLIDNLLQFSRVGRAQMEARITDLNPIIAAVLNDLRPETTGRNIDWQLEDLPLVYADPNLIRYALTNLISNAVKFSRPRDPAIISVNAHVDESGHTVIQVRDNGVGFDPRYVDKLFGVFERLHTEREFEGTGIGLANVRRIIERHGGRTWADGGIDEGATFSFSLPRQVTDQTDG